MLKSWGRGLSLRLQCQAQALASQATALLEELRTTNRQLQAYTGDEALRADLGATIHQAAGTMASLRTLAATAEQDLPPATTALRTAAERIGHLAATVDDQLGREQLARLVSRLEAASADLARTTGQLPALVAEMGSAYPELQRTEGLIAETLKLEEIRFRETLARGLKLLEEASTSIPACLRAVNKDGRCYRRPACPPSRAWTLSWSAPSSRWNRVTTPGRGHRRVRWG